MPVKNLLTIDVECWFHSYNLRRGVARSRWRRYPPRLAQPMQSILNLLDAHRVTATFFVLGWVADSYPEVVQMIDERGHEIASHGYSHELVTSMSPLQFKRDTTRSLEAIGRHSSQSVIGYRASNFTIVKETLWALDVLEKLGFRYDSSVFPTRRSRYGIQTYPIRHPHQIQLRHGRRLFEFPLAAIQLGRLSAPIAGGGYLRLYPRLLTETYIRMQNAAGRPVVVYVHPWELDVDQPRMRIDRWSHFLNYTGLATTEKKLKSLLARFQFGSIRDTLACDEAGQLFRGTSVSIDSILRRPNGERKAESRRPTDRLKTLTYG